jgi:lysophospholipase L1-like esterase
MKHSRLAGLVASIMGASTLCAVGSGCGTHDACSDPTVANVPSAGKSATGLISPRAHFRTAQGNIDTRSTSPASGSGTDSSSDCGGSASTAADAGNGSSSSTQATSGVQYYGRWDTSDAANPVGNWGDIYLKAKFEGTSVGVVLDDANDDFEWSVDGAPMQRLSPNEAHQYTLATGLTDTTHTLSLYRLTEGSFGLTVVSGILLDAGKSLLPADPRPSRRIEVIGDSISAGFGNENAAASASPVYDRHTQNGYMAYGPQLARMLDAEWSVVAHSGQGLYRNLCEPLPPGSDHMPDEFKLMFYPDGAGDLDPAWSFDSWQPDVLIIALGTNDWMDYPPGSCGLPGDADFTGAYESFLAFARSVYPSAEIFALGTFMSAAGNPFARCNADICSAVNAMTAQGDAHVHCIDPGGTGPDGAWLPDETDFVGDWTHPTIAGDTKVANRLRDIIKPIVGW